MKRHIKAYNQEFELEKRNCKCVNCTMTFWVKPESKQPFCSVECFEVSSGRSWLGFGRMAREGVGGNIWRKGKINGGPGGEKRTRIDKMRMQKEKAKPEPIQLGNSRPRSLPPSE